MSHMKGKLFVLDMRTAPGEDRKEVITISNGENVLCRIQNVVKKGPLEDDDTENARRIVACWNHCEHISTENLEAGPGVHSRAMLPLLEEIADVVDKNEELIRENEKLKLALSKVTTYQGYVS